LSAFAQSLAAIAFEVDSSAVASAGGGSRGGGGSGGVVAAAVAVAEAVAIGADDEATGGGEDATGHLAVGAVTVGSFDPHAHAARRKSVIILVCTASVYDRSMSRRLFWVLPLLIACGGGDDTSNADASGDAAVETSSGQDATSDVVTKDTSSGNDTGSDSPTGSGVPPFGASSNGTGGANNLSGATESASSITYRLIVPASPAKPCPLLIVFSGTEGGATMTSNLIGVGPSTGTDGFIRAVLDGVVYNGNGAAGATVLDDVRAKYDIDNDRTYLLSESAGTTAGLKLGFHLRESYFAAYWVNDVNASDAPAQTASQIAFAPWGQVGPGGDFTDANAIVSAMQTAGYRLPNPAPYNGSGAGTHGDPNQFIAAVSFFPGKTRK